MAAWMRRLRLLPLTCSSPRHAQQHTFALLSRAAHASHAHALRPSSFTAIDCFVTPFCPSARIGLMPVQGHAKRPSAPQSEGKPAKRTRVSRACDQCRVAREKCDGLQPTCSTCSGTTRKCSYTANPKKRGIQPGYIRALELALAWLFQHNPENESMLKEKLAEGGASSFLLSRESTESNKLHRRWRRSKFYMDVDTQLSGGEPSRHEQADALDPASSDDDSDTRDPLNDKPARSHGSSVQPTDAAATPNGPVSIPQDSWKLVEIYFANVHSWLPICEKHDTLKLAYSYNLQGHPLNSEQSGLGSRAELWSILTVASLYDTNTNEWLDPTSARPVKLYETSKSMIPSESGCFDIGHVRALLNLVVFNMSRMLTASAWLLVGQASRLLESVGQQTLMTNSRHKHVYYGCFLLDSILSFQLNRRPHFRKSDLEHLGPIDEDGLEEWQPWSGFDDPSHAGSMTPLLSLSTFNSVIELVDQLVSLQQRSGHYMYQEEAVQRLGRWKANLPTKLDTLFSSNAFPLLAPPTVLLQTTYYCASFAANPSDSSMQRLLNILEQCQRSLGAHRLPVPVKSLVVAISRLATRVNLHEATRNQLQRMKMIMTGASSQPDDQDVPRGLESSIPVRNASISMNLSTSEALPTVASSDHTTQPRTDSVSTFFSAPHSTHAPLMTVPSPAQSDPRYPEHTSDLETFFDELASLDSATRLDNQPQFMQNLGFEPEASMADLFSEYIPLQSSTFLTRDDMAPPGLEQYAFYDAS